MMIIGKEAVFAEVVKTICKMSDDWDDVGEIGPETLLIADLGFESIDIVVLATTIQNHYKKPMPFVEFFAKIGQRQLRDIPVDEFTEFVHQHLNSTASGSVATQCQSLQP